MRVYIARRLVLFIPTILLVVLLVFGLMHIVPGDVIMVKLAESGNLSRDQISAFRHDLGLDRPLHLQFASWLGKVLRGNFGNSSFTDRSVLGEISKALPITVELALLAVFIATALGIPLGIYSALRQDTLGDYAGRVLSVGGLAIPSFWMATLVIIFPAIWWSYIPPIVYVPFLEDPFQNLQQFVVPALILGSHAWASLMRMTRSSFLEVLRQDYVRTAWAKGLRQRVIIMRHCLKNTLNPVVTLMGSLLGALLGGTVIIEQIFSLPGLGRLTYNAILQRDYTQLQGNILLIALGFLFVNLLVDLSYAWLDPRIRYR